MSSNHYLEEIDFSGNPELEAIYIGFSTIRHLNISQNKKLNYLHLEYWDITTAEVDRFVNNLHTIVTSNDTRDGCLLMTSTWDDGNFPGPPSLSSKQKLDDLRYIYNWEVSPYY